MREVNANPTKQFFVSSLTRDISLEDAILDLLDNCVDGIMRTITEETLNSDKPYEGFHAKITANEKEFTIIDNCGGIPLDTAIKQAFRFGRPTDTEEHDNNIPTVGMYGIGMKRAIFKLGRNALVESHHENDSYLVEIPEEWLETDSWILSLEDVERKNEDFGTMITVSKLYPSVSKKFSSATNFLEDLENIISHNFAVIIEKGLEIHLNGKVIESVPLTLFTSSDYNTETEGITPYVYKGSYEDVSLYIAIGFYRELSKLSELENDTNEQIERNRNNAGITVICNDRVVLYKDKTRLTGWGTGTVPSFHNQFNSITGFIEFRSNESFGLPLTTTKRGIDVGAPVYSFALEYAKKGIKKFTDFTNHWKGREDEIQESFANLKQIHSFKELRFEIEDNLRKVNRSENEYHYNPKLPKPEKKVDTVRISYRKKKLEVEKINEYFFADDHKKPSDIGEWCFDEIQKKVSR